MLRRLAVQHVGVLFVFLWHGFMSQDNDHNQQDH